MELKGPRGTLSLLRPQVMGVLNVTPDSFSDGGHFFEPDKARRRALSLVEAGASIIDIGGESTRPGAQPVSEQEEMDRVCPVIEAIRGEVDAWISVDTSQPAVMRAALSVGADLLNDVRSFRREGAEELLQANAAIPVCIMHMQGEPKNMQDNPDYGQVDLEVIESLDGRAAQLSRLGNRSVIVDPGFGFGKRLQDNLRLLNALPDLVALGYPVLVGLSRKSLLGVITGREVSGRLAGSVALATLAASKGAHIVRAHDVAETVDAMKVVAAVQEERDKGR